MSTPTPTDEQWNHVTRRYFDLSPSTQPLPSMIDVVKRMWSDDYATRRLAQIEFMQMVKP